MPKVTVIEAIKQNSVSEVESEEKKLKVAAYARVSTEQDEQQSSYEAQVSYYTQYIKNNPNWEFIGVFADEGITGTSVKKRDGFNQMIGKALNGEIELILTKSISRFARNTVDTLQTVRRLKTAGVEVIFEKENLHTFDPKCEVMLTIMSSLAQEESRSISENVRWGHQKSMQDGNVSVPWSSFLGYRRGEDGRPEIVEEEAVIVRRIYKLFLEGKSLRHIADILMADKIPSPMGKEKWHVKTLQSILTNEKYRGDALRQKTFTVDYLTKEKRVNKGERKQYLVEQSHEPIIDPETFDLVQERIKALHKEGYKPRSRHPFAGKIRCSECGSTYGHKVWRTDNGKKDVWYCNHKYDGCSVCTTPVIEEEQIQKAFLEALAKTGVKLAEFDPAKWQQTVDMVTVYPEKVLYFRFWDNVNVEIPL